MIATGDQTGNLAKVMTRVAEYYGRELNKRILVRHGYTVLTATDSIVLEVVAQARHMNPHVKIIARCTFVPCGSGGGGGIDANSFWRSCRFRSCNARCPRRQSRWRRRAPSPPRNDGSLM